jgi:hypothetical protein
MDKNQIARYGMYCAGVASTITLAQYIPSVLNWNTAILFWAGFVLCFVELGIEKAIRELGVKHG